MAKKEVDYDKLGVTAEELYCRQNGICYLDLKETPSISSIMDLMCTDGKSYYPTISMLNPTPECVWCLAAFVNRMREEMAIDKKLLQLISIFCAEGKEKAVMSQHTFDKLYDYLENSIIFSEETNPLRKDSDDIYLFGVKISLCDSVPENVVRAYTDKGIVDLEIE